MLANPSEFPECATAVICHLATFGQCQSGDVIQGRDLGSRSSRLEPTGLTRMTR